MFFYLQVDLNATIRGFIWAVCMQVREVQKKVRNLVAQKWPKISIRPFDNFFWDITNIFMEKST